ncbi:hypothetical protein F5144DRAFT_554285, partial [Chaetomium tenue]
MFFFFLAVLSRKRLGLIRGPAEGCGSFHIPPLQSVSSVFVPPSLGGASTASRRRRRPAPFHAERADINGRSTHSTHTSLF